MRIAILSGNNHGWHVQTLARAAAGRGHQVHPCLWRDLSIDVGDGQSALRAGDAALDDQDLVLLRTMPAGSLEQIVFRMDVLGRLAAGGKRVVNSPRAMEIAVDKYLALSLMSAADLPVPPTVVCQRTTEALEAFHRLGGDVVIKPLFGSEGLGMTRVGDAELARRAFILLERLGHVIYVQRFIEHQGADLRLWVLGHQVLTAMRRRNNHWRTNIAQGGRGEPFAPDAAMSDLAVRAARACQAEVAGVDVLLDRDSKPYVIEVNAVPGWRELERVTGVNIAEELIRHLESGVVAS